MILAWNLIGQKITRKMQKNFFEKMIETQNNMKIIDASRNMVFIINFKV